MSGRASEAVIDPVVARQRFGVLAGRFNEAISEKLLDGALRAFATHGVPRTAVETHWVPGSFELPRPRWRSRERAATRGSSVWAW